MNNMKMLFLLNKNNKTHRIIRRAIIVGVLSFIAILINELVGQAPAIIVPIITAIGVAIDKAISESRQKPVISTPTINNIPNDPNSTLER